MFRIRSLSSLAYVLAGTVVLSACGGGGSHGTLPATPSQALTPGTPVDSASATFVFTFPKDSSSSNARKTASLRSPKYLSSATKSISLQVTDTKNSSSNADIYTNVPAALKTVQTANFANLTGNGSIAGQCGTDPSNAGNYKCTAKFQLPVGINTLTLASWDANGGTGNKLSQNIATVTTVQGVANGPGGAYTISLDGNAAAITVTGSGACQNGTVGSAYGSVGTSPVAFTVSFADLASKTIVAPGLPKIQILGNDSVYHSDSGTINGTGGTVAFTINQSAQSFTLTPSNSTVTNASVSVQGVPPGSDGLTFTTTKAFTFSTGTAPPSHNFLAAVEQTTATSAQVDFYNVSLGSNTPGSDTFSAFSPATLAVTNSINEGKPDVDNPVDLKWDTTGDLLIANSGTGGADTGSMACVPIGAIATGANASTTVSTNVDDPIQTSTIAYDARDGSVAIANTPSNAPYQLAEFTLSGNYVAAPVSRDYHAAGFGALSVTTIPDLAAGTYAVALQKGADEDPSFGANGNNKVTVVKADGTSYDIVDDTNFNIDEPFGVAYDSANHQLVVANNTSHHRLVSFWTTGTSSATFVKNINTTHKNTYVATSGDGHVAVAWLTSFGYMQVQVYANASGATAPTAVGGPIPYNGTTTSCGSTYIYGNGTTIVNGMQWLSNTKLMVAVEANSSGSPNSLNGLYVYDITNLTVPTGFDDVTCNAFTAAPTQTGFVHLNNHPFGIAFKP
jgi:hypothetical protein